MAEALDLSRLDSVFEKHRGEEGALIPVLQEAQEIYGYLSEELLAAIGKRLHIPLSRIFGVVTFLCPILHDSPGSLYGDGSAGERPVTCEEERMFSRRFSRLWASERVRPHPISNSPLKPWRVWEPVPFPPCFWSIRITTES